jgi:hypothetical protein
MLGGAGLLLLLPIVGFLPVDGVGLTIFRDCGDECESLFRPSDIRLISPASWSAWSWLQRC